MTLTDADVQAIANGYLAREHEVISMAAELIALRARRAQDTPSDPAAWGLVYLDDRLAAATTDIRRRDYWREGGQTVIPLVRAPGAVAAAPTEDEQIEAFDADLRSCLGNDDGDRIEDVAKGLHSLGYRRLVPPAPSAGEDEAAVERVAAYLRGCGDEGPEDDEVDAAWGNGEAAPRPLLRSDLRRLTAAARGPRTQDDT